MEDLSDTAADIDLGLVDHILHVVHTEPVARVCSSYLHSSRICLVAHTRHRSASVTMELFCPLQLVAVVANLVGAATANSVAYQASPRLFKGVLQLPFSTLQSQSLALAELLAVR